MDQVPVIPGINDDEQEMSDIAGYLGKLGGIGQVRLLKYHSMGGYKYETLGIEPAYDSGGTVLTDPYMESLAAIFKGKCAAGVEILY
jgi:hypothetical protein